jgi:hypothetical protein
MKESTEEKIAYWAPVVLIGVQVVFLIAEFIVLCMIV